MNDSEQSGPAGHFLVVGIGASAGGLEALESFLRPMPAHNGMAFVIITHIGSGRESALAEILSRATSMTVEQAIDGVALQRDHVYVLPTDATLLIEDGRIRLRQFSNHRERAPIDVFLASLAQNSREDAVAVILSGGGNDGTLGVKAIKEQGGLTLAQGSGGSAPHSDSMPNSAIASGLIDLVLPVEDMAAKLLDYVARFDRLDGLTAPGFDQADLDQAGLDQAGLDQAGLDQAGLDQTGPRAADEPLRLEAEAVERARQAICDQLRLQLHHDFGGYKHQTFLRRVQRRMQVRQVTDIDSYAALLEHDADEVSALFRDLLIGVTNFFRDEAVFSILEQRIIPPLFEGRGTHDTIRVWVPGCSTGEEVYSLAILLHERAAGLRARPRIQIFGTDIDEAALAVARAGRYPEPLLQGVSAERRANCFVADGASFVVDKAIREMCMFSSHSVIRDPPFSRIDLISCRNLLIYFGIDLQAQVIPVFHYALRPNAHLVLGTSENVNQFSGLFAPVERGQRVFKRMGEAGRGRMPQTLFAPSVRSLIQSIGPRATLPRRNLKDAAESRVLEQFAPAYVVVNPEGDIVYYSARTGRYLEPPSGLPTQQLIMTVRRSLRLDLRTALQEAAETRRTVIRQHVALEVDDRVQMVTLTVDPLPEPRDTQADAPHVLVLFANEAAPFSLQAADAASTERAVSAANVERLDHELQETRERLQLLIEEYETALEELKSANEELVSVNEEVQSTNEELETSKEEVQSINEELHAVNAELMLKVDEHDRSNTDLRNLFDSVQLATVFLDRHLRIRNFTPAVTAIFDLLPSDRGRLLTDLATELDGVNLRREIEAVLEAHEPSERSVTRDGRPPNYLMRLLPYWTSDGAVDGVLVTFVDVTSLVGAEEQQRLLVTELNHRVRNMLQVVAGVSAQTMKRSVSMGEFSDSFLGRLYAMGRSYELLSRERWTEVGLGELLRKVLQPYDTGAQRIVVTGPRVLAKPAAALALGMVLHELATNAAKYGAFSVPDGSVRVTLSVVPKAVAADAAPGVTGRELVIEWQESGGPPVLPPDRRGLGTELIERQFRYELKGRAVLDFLTGGLRARLRMPLDPRLLTAVERREALQ